MYTSLNQKNERKKKKKKIRFKVALGKGYVGDNSLYQSLNDHFLKKTSFFL